MSIREGLDDLDEYSLGPHKKTVTYRVLNALMASYLNYLDGCLKKGTFRCLCYLRPCTYKLRVFLDLLP